MIKKKHFARLLHLGVGVHSFGNATSLLAKPGRLTLEITDMGILCTHLEFKKKAMVPYSNIKAFELAFDSDFMQEEEEEPMEDASYKASARLAGDFNPEFANLPYTDTPFNARMPISEDLPTPSPKKKAGAKK